MAKAPGAEAAEDPAQRNDRIFSWGLQEAHGDFPDGQIILAAFGLEEQTTGLLHGERHL